MFKILFYLGCVILASAQTVLVTPRVDYADNSVPTAYDFSYTAPAEGGSSSHQQSGDGYGRVTGSYSVEDDDGRQRIVDYIADEAGFRASISTNEPGTANQNPADVTIASSADNGNSQDPPPPAIVFPQRNPPAIIAAVAPETPVVPVAIAPPPPIPIQRQVVPFRRQQLVPIQPALIPVQPSLFPVRSNLIPIQPNLIPVTRNLIQVQPNLVPVEPNLVRVQPNLVPVQPNLVPVQQNLVQVQPEVISPRRFIVPQPLFSLNTDRFVPRTVFPFEIRRPIDSPSLVRLQDPFQDPFFTRFEREVLV